MIANFPSRTAQLTEPTSIALLEALQQREIVTPLRSQPIPTAYVQQGSGDPPIVLLHGFDSSVFEFRRLLPLLAPQHRTWIIDLLGFGFTDRPADVAFSPTTIRTHLHATWQALIGQPMVLVGASMGGAAAIDFTLTYPDLVQKLVLIDSAGMTAGPPGARFLIPPLGYLAAEFLRHPRVRRQVSQRAYFDQRWASADAAACAALHLQHPRWHQAIIAFTKSGGYGSFAARLPQMTQPTLIVWGRADRILGTADASQFQQAIPHSQLVWLEDCGHVPHLEQPQLTAAAILTFAQSAAAVAPPQTAHD